jgi:hypothetical protein
MGRDSTPSYGRIMHGRRTRSNRGEPAAFKRPRLVGWIGESALLLAGVGCFAAFARPNSHNEAFTSNAARAAGRPSPGWRYCRPSRLYATDPRSTTHCCRC